MISLDSKFIACRCGRVCRISIVQIQPVRDMRCTDHAEYAGLTRPTRQHGLGPTDQESMICPRGVEYSRWVIIRFQNYIRVFGGSHLELVGGCFSTHKRDTST